VERFADIDWRPSGLGNPLLRQALAWLDCELVDEHDAGDHTIVVGAVRELESSGATGPLVFFRGRFGSFQLDRCEDAC
jgi:3-hydroxy-9,10-secoandrosta-1,3,5(10)-triene-9,17-dione monooxygenase reductase component